MHRSTGHLLPPQLGTVPGAGRGRQGPGSRPSSPTRQPTTPASPSRPIPKAPAPEAAIAKAAGAKPCPSPEALLAPPAAVELRPPVRELGVAGTAEVLRRLRRDRGLFTELSLAEIEDLAELCSPFGFKRAEVLFARGEPASWLGIILAGRVSASVPHAGAGGGELRLGDHMPGEFVGASRVALWERSHARAYTLRAAEEGCIAVISYDQLESVRRNRPAFHHALFRVLMAQLADACGSFFRGCPVSDRLRWPISNFTERRVLDFLLQLRDEGRLLAGADYHSLLALACRMRVTEWQARTSVLSRGEPLPGALLVIDGKLTGFRDAGGSPSVWFGPGDCVGLEFVLGGVQPCPMDIFAARPSLAALLLPSDLEDLRREYPVLATQVLQGLYAKLFAELLAPHGEALLLLAEAGERVQFSPGSSPALPSPPLPCVRHLSPEEAQVALKLAESTAPVPRWVNPLHTTTSIDGQAAREEAALRRLITDPQGVTASWAEQEPLKAEWLLGSFLTQRLADSQAAGAEGRANAREAAVQAIMRGSLDMPPGSPSAESRVLAADGRQHPMATSGGFDGFGAGSELRLGLTSGSRRHARSPSRDRDASPARGPASGQKAGRPTSAPPGARRGVSNHWLTKLPGCEEGTTNLLLKQPTHVLSCPKCNTRVPFPKKLLTGQQDSQVMVRQLDKPGEHGFDPKPRKVARIVSSAYRHGNRADFYLDGQRIPLENSKWNMHEQNRRGVNVVTIDADSQLVVSAMCYDTAGGGVAASQQLAADLNALPEARVVLIAVRGSGLEGLQASALKALHRVGASATISGGRPQEGYALIGSKGGQAIAERRGHIVEVEGRLPRAPWQEPQDLSWYFAQQNQFLADLKVGEDRHDAWSSKVTIQESEIQTLKAKVQALEQERDGVRADLKQALRERDEWQVSALRVMSKREFRSSVEALEAAKRREQYSSIGA
eukprot:TRINITY_DN29756_c0_g1_i1.p1 TRINITY_DN29756_c0_g1~~TRINITY_DN29756_c0_g1_i1.p1  ORF type:complete len:954 (+),score=151.92 TRINITY_DN29756_c0_g1_i1:41-2902(+)